MTLKKRRESLKLPQKVIAAALGVSRSHVLRMETGERAVPKKYFKDGRARLWATILSWQVADLKAAIQSNPEK